MSLTLGMLPSKGIVTPSDPNFANVDLLLHLNGTQGGQSFPDSGPFNRTMSLIGDVHTSTNQSQFGGSSGAFDNSLTGNYGCLYNDDAGNANTNTQWTVEFWIRPTSLTGVPLQIGAGSGNRLYFNYSGSNIIATTAASSGFAHTIGFSSITTSVWTHIALACNGADLYSFVNGVLKAHDNVTFSWKLDRQITIGSTPQARNTTNKDKINGYMDDFRYTNGVCRYTNTFSVPTAQYPDH